MLSKRSILGGVKSRTSYPGFMPNVLVTSAYPFRNVLCRPYLLRISVEGAGGSPALAFYQTHFFNASGADVLLPCLLQTRLAGKTLAQPASSNHCVRFLANHYNAVCESVRLPAHA